MNVDRLTWIDYPPTRGHVESHELAHGFDVDGHVAGLWLFDNRGMDPPTIQPIGVVDNVVVLWTECEGDWNYEAVNANGYRHGSRVVPVDKFGVPVGVFGDANSSVADEQLDKSCPYCANLTGVSSFVLGEQANCASCGRNIGWRPVDVEIFGNRSISGVAREVMFLGEKFLEIRDDRRGETKQYNRLAVFSVRWLTEEEAEKRSEARARLEASWATEERERKIDHAIDAAMCGVELIVDSARRCVMTALGPDDWDDAMFERRFTWKIDVGHLIHGKDPDTYKVAESGDDIPF